jgi:hypothetical protein
MRKNTLFTITSIAYLLAFSSSNISANEFEIRGNIELQNRSFFETPLYSTQPSNDISIAAAPEFFWSWNDGKDLIEFVPSARIDQHDEERTHSDIRELSWIHVSDNWESRIGIRRVFWGVTEFQHLVDIINQSDSVEDIDNEDKLGQPMLNLSFVNDWGILDLYALPYFRERTFSGMQGRPTIPFVNAGNAYYESSDEEKHLDLAVRWSHSIDEFELALSWFGGTSRDPILEPSLNINFEPEFVPYYQQIKQIGFEMQANLDDLLWKLEVIHNDNPLDSFFALQGGFEYSQYGVFDSNADLGWLVEYGWDQRDENATGIAQNDLFFGSRLAMNDVDSSELLAGLSYDLDYQSTSFIIEASRRFGDSVKLSLDLRLFESDDSQDPTYQIRRDDHIQFTAQYYY